MPFHLNRLRHGGTWWTSGIALRITGMALLGACARLAFHAHRVIVAIPRHVTTPGQFLLAVATFLLLVTGLAFTIEGRGLFRLVPLPPRRLW